ncbi:MAG: PorT family protein [Bacteroidetes bacterium]|nr:MAG: PorT family protein [Bacteroidota bacterium]
MSKQINRVGLLAALVMFLSIFNIAEAEGQRRFRFENLPQYDDKDYHFGFSLGFNKMDFALRPIDNLHNTQMAGNSIDEFDTLKSVLTRAEYGFHIGIVSNLRLADQWDLRFIPTLSFGDRNIIYRGVRDGNSVTRTQPIESTFIDLPLHLKYKSIRMTNTRAYVIGGIKYSYDLASVEDKEDFEEVVLATIGRNDFFYELGVGFEHYFYFFKFSTEIKASFGLRDMLSRENSMFTNSIDRLNSKIIMISFMFE